MEDWVYLISMRGARMMPVDDGRALMADAAGIEVTDWHLRYWARSTFSRAPAPTSPCLDAFAGANPAPNMTIIGTALHQTFLRNLADLADRSFSALGGAAVLELTSDLRYVRAKALPRAKLAHRTVGIQAVEQ